jgi:alpha-mannosidase
MTPKTVHIVSHTHWDREWYLTFEQFRLRLVGLVDRLLDLMESRPDFEFFHLDGQTIVLEDYLELRPEQEPRLRKLIAEGRILIGPCYDMPDEFLVSGESLVRNLALGQRVAARFGTPMPVGYLPDLFGHVGQMPQILRHFGLDNAILWRGFGGPRAEYWWEAPDGSRVLMLHLPPEGYCNATRVHLDPKRMIDRTAAAIQREAARTSVGEVLLMNGVDHVEPHPVIPELARQLTATMGSPVQHSTLPRYVDAVRTAVGRNGVADSLEVIRGELRAGEEYANLLPGVFSARVYIKQANARVQTLLEKYAEPLATFAWMLGESYPAGELRYAWKTLLQNHPHDSICGCSVDAVHAENMTRFARSEQVARAIVDQSATAIARQLPAGRAGVIRLVALNTSNQPFSGTIEATVDVPYENGEPGRHVDDQALDAPVTFWAKGSRPASLTASDGRDVPLQVLNEDDVLTFVMMRYDTPWGLNAHRYAIAWKADVPSCGYASFDLALSDGEPGLPPAVPKQDAGPEQLENEFIRLRVNTDATVDIDDKTTGTRYERCGELEDVGDVGDEYNYSPPVSDRRITSADARNVRVTRTLNGPIRDALRIDFTLPLPLSATADRSARSAETVDTPVSISVSLDAHSPRVHWALSIDNHSLDHRLRILFPTGASDVTTVRAETAFGVALRVARREVPPASRWEVPVSYGPTGAFTEAGDDRSGAVLFGDGLVEYEAVPDADGHVSRLGLTLIRAVGYLSRSDLALRPSGHAGPGLATPGAQCLGPSSFRLAFEPRAARPSNAALFARAASFVAPPHVIAGGGSGATLPPTASFLTIRASSGAVVLSACHKAAEDDAILVRVFNPDDTPATIEISTRERIGQAQLVDFLERRQQPLPVVDGRVTIDVGPGRIVTTQLSR